MHAITHGPRFPIKDGSAFIVAVESSLFVQGLLHDSHHHGNDGIKTLLSGARQAFLLLRSVIRLCLEFFQNPPSLSLLKEGRSEAELRCVAVCCVVLCCD